MEVIQQSWGHETLPTTIEDLPDEVLEFILSFLPPYKDLQNCMTVCKRWCACAQNVLRKTSIKLIKAVAEFNILWKNVTSTDIGPTITKRFSHAACILKNNMYIFGGCTTNSTSFNDLWMFDLSKRRWIRPLATGTYPVPKAYTSMVHYQDCLIVFGGWTYPSLSQYYQNITMFNDIHLYCVTTNKWILINATNPPPPMAGHSACIRGDEMVVFGGLVMSAAQNYQMQCSNDVWVLDIITFNWRKQQTTKPRPSPRYAQSLITLDSERLMLLGGIQTLHNRFVYSDCWILTMQGPTWTWKEIAVKNKEWASANIWCNPACRVGDMVVSLSRSRHGWNGAKPLVTSAVRLSALNRPENAPVSVRIERSLQRPLDRDQNINGRRGVLPRQPASRQPPANINNEPIAGPSNEQERDKDVTNEIPSHETNAAGPSSDLKFNNNVIDLNKKEAMRKNKTKNKGMKIVRQLQEANKYRMAAFACDSSSNNTPNENDLINQRQIAHLENRLEPYPPAAERPDVVYRQPPVIKRNTLTMHVLDISTVLNGNCMNYVSWLCPRLGDMNGAPEELVMYSLVKGNGELIMFGGVHNEIRVARFTENPQSMYSNSLHFITAPRDII
ncbi:PREDICTED: F-box only protein 42 [Papilio xuthus]|uniref:F-box only protein 42 n=1 Tax=Papilio xuthus TaxID=66420 RepID=A0A194PU57_PAPXU|nr:PREDICTED: F-box only protein 42 [Papilio xuthus]KPI94670.1 F-box only protein 42 [Papilio xuthus]